MELELKSR